MVRPTTCDCGAPIVFVRMQTGSAMPCDPDEVEVMVRESGKRQRGDVTIATDDGYLHVGPRVVPGDDLFAATAQGTTARGRVPHWASCPNSAQHRKDRR